MPVGLGLLLDISDSMFGRRIQDARSAVERFLIDLLTPDDEFFIMAFNHKPRVLTGWTREPDLVRRTLDALRPSAAPPCMTRSSNRCRSWPSAHASVPPWS